MLVDQCFTTARSNKRARRCALVNIRAARIARRRGIGAESLLDTSLRPLRSLKQVQNGGAYLLKGKDFLDPPPSFFGHRPPLAKASYKQLGHLQIAMSSSNSRAETPATRPSTSAIQMDLDGSTSSQCTSPVSRSLPMHETWQAEVRLNKHLTAGGKNLPPTHRRYDLWTVLPRSRPESANIFHGDRIQTALSYPC